MEITPLPSTQKGPEQWFTGDVWFDVPHLATWEIGDGSTGPDTDWADEVTPEQYEGTGA